MSVATQMNKPWLRGLRQLCRPKTKKPKDDPGERQRKWFDDVELEDTTELLSLNRDISSIIIQIPQGESDTDLITLVKYANEIPKDGVSQKKSLDLLESYLEKIREEDNKKMEAVVKADQIRDRRKEESHEHGALYETLHEKLRALTPYLNNVFDFVLKALSGTLKTIDVAASIAAEITCQTHYQIAVKAIMLFITAYQNAGKLGGRVKDMLKKIDGYGQDMRTLQENIRTVPMAKAINKLFSSIVSFIVTSGSYMKHAKMGQMVHFLAGANEKFESLLETIREDYAEVTRIMSMAHLMFSISSHENTKGIKNDTLQIIEQLSLLNQSLTPRMSEQLRIVYEQSIFQAEVRVQTLRSMVFDASFDPSTELLFNERERIFLSPKDRWPRHFNKSMIPATSRNVRTLVWISGGVGRRNVSWVSSFSIDLISHSNQFKNFDSVYVFCKRGQGQQYSPTILIKALIVQLLETHALVAMKNPSRLSLNRFEEIGTKTSPSPGKLAWKLLEDILRLIETTPEFQRRVVLLLIDRLDLCISEEDFSVLNDLIPRLQSLSHGISRVQVLITTGRIPHHIIPTLRRGSDWLRAFG